MDAVEVFIQHIQFEKRYSEHTVREYQSDITLFTEFLSVKFNQTNPLTVSPMEIREWILYLLEKNESNSTIHRRISALKSFFKYHIKMGNAAKNPASNLLLPKKNTPLPSFLDEKQITQLFNIMEIDWANFPKARDYMILTTFYLTGIRRSELINLKIDDINLQNHTIIVTGKRNKQRIIPVPHWYINQVQKYLVLRREIATTAPNVLFLNNRGKPLSPKFVYQIVRNHLTLVTHQNRKSPHTMRHTFATHMLNSGADLNTIKELLGHSSLAATQIYTHNNFEKLKKSYKQSHPRG